jgi:hypothetical protein
MKTRNAARWLFEAILIRVPIRISSRLLQQRVNPVALCRLPGRLASPVLVSWGRPGFEQQLNYSLGQLFDLAILLSKLQSSGFCSGETLPY